MDRAVKPFAKFTDAEVVLILSPKLIADALWRKTYGQEIPPVVREVALALMYLVKKFDGLVPQWLLLRTVAENLEFSEDVVAMYINTAVDLGIITVVTPELDPRQRLYGFTDDQKDHILTAGRAEAFAYSLAMEQSKDPKNPLAGKNAANEGYYRTILTRLNNHDHVYEANMKRLSKIRHLLSVAAPWLIVGVITLIPWCEALASWSTGRT